MPNWCSNRITISHDDPTMISRAKKNLNEFLQTFIPTPSELMDGDGWYQWRINNWGTKWDVQLELLEESETALIATFDSAWSPPIEAYRKLEAMGFKITALYCEPLMEFAGKYKDGNDSFIPEINFEKDEWRHLPHDLVEFLEPQYVY